jgi:hypothetical protein
MISFTFLIAACICVAGAWAEMTYELADYYVVSVLSAMAMLCMVAGVVMIEV